MTNQQSNQKRFLYLPHNFLAEKIILSCLLIHPESIELAKQNLSIESFYFKNHQEIYEIILKIDESKKSIDVFSMLTFLQENGLLKNIGGSKVLLELITQTPNLIYLEDYILLIKEKFLRRLLIKFGLKLINSGYIINLPFEKIIKDLETEVFKLTSEIQLNTQITSTKLLNEILFTLQKNFGNSTLSGLSSGFTHLDFLTQGFQKSDLIILAGRPSLGKTALSLNIALNSLKQSKSSILFFSLEMSKEQIMYRILASEANINQTKLKKGQLYKNDWLKINQIIKIISTLTFFIYDTPSLTIQDLRLKIKTILLDQPNLSFIIIDYLQLMRSSLNSKLNRVQEISEITRSLKILAREFNIPIMVLSQLNRTLESRNDQKPILSDLRESGSIEQDADVILMLHKNSNKYDNIVELIVAKQRNGPIGSTKLLFHKKESKFLEIDPLVDLK